jgi:hypothetical protein
MMPGTASSRWITIPGGGANPREAYTYDGLHQRITVESDSERNPNGTPAGSGTGCRNRSR